MVPHYSLNSHTKLVFPSSPAVSYTHLIVLETNRYAQVELDTVDVQNRQKWFPTTVDELKTLFAIILLMSQNPKQRLEVYWTKRKILHTPIFSEVMPYKLFLLLCKYLHFTTDFVEGDDDRLRKPVSYTHLAVVDHYCEDQSSWASSSLL